MHCWSKYQETGIKLMRTKYVGVHINDANTTADISEWTSMSGGCFIV